MHLSKSLYYILKAIVLSKIFLYFGFLVKPNEKKFSWNH